MYTEVDEKTGRTWIVVEHLDEIPATFASDEEQADWYATHEFTEDVSRQLLAQPVPGAVVDMIARGNPAIAAQLNRAADIAPHDRGV